MKKKFVNNIFENIANQYDLMNDLMSFGLHHSWKKKFIDQININFKKKNKILDLGCGTGDIVSKIINNNLNFVSNSKFYLVDPNIKMIEEGIKKIKKKNISWITSYGEFLPFKNNNFDLVTMSFSLRNVENINKCLKEINRVLKKGGQFLCLEFGKIDNLGLSSIYKFYSDNFIPKLGKVVTGNENAYKYLVESIKKFPSQIEISKTLKKNKFKEVSYFNLNFGVVTIYSCKK